jgi:hypothetical protein
MADVRLSLKRNTFNETHPIARKPYSTSRLPDSHRDCHCDSRSGPTMDLPGFLIDAVPDSGHCNRRTAHRLDCAASLANMAYAGRQSIGCILVAGSFAHSESGFLATYRLDLLNRNRLAHHPKNTVSGE